MFPVAIGLNHRSAPVEIRERMSFHPSQMKEALKKLKSYPGLEGVLILSTCNRTEIYAATTEVELGIVSIKKFLASQHGIEEKDFIEYSYVHTLYDAVRHLFRVTSGLDSMVRGETQIIGQVASAYEQANEAAVTNKAINVFFQTALAVGKRIRTETLIDQHPVSISYTAVELAKQHFGELEGKGILIMGAGEMSTLTAKNLVAAGASTVLVSNRSYEKAVNLAQEISGRAVRFDDMDQYLEEVDIVISATAAKHFVLLPQRIQEVMTKRKERPLLLIDIAVPRDIHPEVGDIPLVTLFDIDDLRGVIDRHHQEREIAALNAEKIIDEEMGHFLKWHNSLFVVPTIVALQQKGQKIKELQLERAFERLSGLTPKQEKIIRSMANSIVNHLLHVPITNLKEYASTSQGHLYTEILQNLFDLDVEEEEKRPAKTPHHHQHLGQAHHGRAEAE
ncbi:glutamyl-tRNA reductase [Desulfosporosinus sp. BICA1-9]|uniref:glutamyl-tRNA reductase n=1 Tax=Desulfosporosinus sp. BICA1-9 TaxID=1531958 RepID=UPI00054BD066|nr:glutamyl-tRNA reductase [Desulfosporosinus sp. BICA1-9]KJS90634.1 MAG: glutamyl-tRNA reductase [Desulfosporosinus sp. BICA1-9]HBW34534.1 glutamyl-tRNA reductase [Desulfosporosinus sp.]